MDKKKSKDGAKKSPGGGKEKSRWGRKKSSRREASRTRLRLKLWVCSLCSCVGWTTCGLIIVSEAAKGLWFIVILIKVDYPCCFVFFMITIVNLPFK